MKITQKQFKYAIIFGVALCLTACGNNAKFPLDEKDALLQESFRGSLETAYPDKEAYEKDFKSLQDKCKSVQAYGSGDAFMEKVIEVKNIQGDMFRGKYRSESDIPKDAVAKFKEIEREDKLIARTRNNCYNYVDFGIKKGYLSQDYEKYDFVVDDWHFDR